MSEPLGTISELRSALDAGAVSSAELVDRALARAAAVEPTLHALRATREEGARAEAAEADDRRARGAVRSALDGIPIALKDNLAHAGELVGCASKILEGYRSPFDATAVERLREAGAKVVVCSHLGRPKGVDPAFSMAPVTARLGEVGERFGQALLVALGAGQQVRMRSEIDLAQKLA